MIHKYNAYRKAAGSIAKVGHKIETIKDIKGLVRIMTIKIINKYFSFICILKGRYRKKN